MQTLLSRLQLDTIVVITVVGIAAVLLQPVEVSRDSPSHEIALIPAVRKPTTTPQLDRFLGMHHATQQLTDARRLQQASGLPPCCCHRDFCELPHHADRDRVGIEFHIEAILVNNDRQHNYQLALTASTGMSALEVPSDHAIQELCGLCDLVEPLLLDVRSRDKHARKPTKKQLMQQG
jgi:hypothetical protein